MVASLGAYIWLVLILSYWSPDLIEVWEGLLTFLFMPLLVLVAYLLDIGYFDHKKKKRLGTTPVARLDPAPAAAPCCSLLPAACAA